MINKRSLAGRFVAHLACGAAAMSASVESIKDSHEAGTEAAQALRAGDDAIGLTASSSAQSDFLILPGLV